MTRSKKIPYNAQLDMLISNTCNFACKYCMSWSHLNKRKTESINIPKFLNVLEDTGKTFNINFCGYGDPFLIPNLVEACSALTKKHYVSVVTNMVSPKIKEFSEQINPQRVIKLTGSAHIKELERLNLTAKYFYNLSLLKNKGFSTASTVVAGPSLINEVKKYKINFASRGVHLEFNPYYGINDNKIYPDSYTRKERKIIDTLPVTNTQAKAYYTYKKPCDAGYSSASVFPNGDVKICGQVNEKIGNIYQKISFNSKLKICPCKKCPCPPLLTRPLLFEQSLKEAGTFKQNLVFISRKTFKKQKYLLKNELNIFNQTIDRYIGKLGKLIKFFYPRLYFKLKGLKTIKRFNQVTAAE